jgi:hypothetical protein
MVDKQSSRHVLITWIRQPWFGNETPASKMSFLMTNSTTIHSHFHLRVLSRTRHLRAKGLHSPMEMEDEQRKYKVDRINCQTSFSIQPPLDYSLERISHVFLKEDYLFPGCAMLVFRYAPWAKEDTS